MRLGIPRHRPVLHSCLRSGGRRLGRQPLFDGRRKHWHLKVLGASLYVELLLRCAFREVALGVVGIAEDRLKHQLRPSTRIEAWLDGGLVLMLTPSSWQIH